MYVAVFNVGDRDPASVQVDFGTIGLPAECTVRDLWEHKDLGVSEGGRSFPVSPHGSGLYRIAPVK
jgi:hypothetical protein